jgi:hypothetical protein
MRHGSSWSKSIKQSINFIIFELVPKKDSTTKNTKEPRQEHQIISWTAFVLYGFNKWLEARIREFIMRHRRQTNDKIAIAEY